MKKYVGHSPFRVRKTPDGREIFWHSSGDRRGEVVLVRSGDIAEAIYANFEAAIKVADMIEAAPRNLTSKLKAAIETLTPGILVGLYSVVLLRGASRMGSHGKHLQAEDQRRRIRKAWKNGNPHTGNSWRSQKELARSLNVGAKTISRALAKGQN